VRPDYHDATAKEFLSEKDADSYRTGVGFRLLCGEPHAQAKALVEHYLDAAPMAVRLDRLIYRYDRDPDPEVAEAINALAERIARKHALELGIELKWGGGDKP
jgi:hypothetical protein